MSKEISPSEIDRIGRKGDQNSVFGIDVVQPFPSEFELNRSGGHPGANSGSGPEQIYGIRLPYGAQRLDGQIVVVGWKKLELIVAI